MEAQAKNKKARTSYGKKHLPICILKWIHRAGISEKEFFEQYPTYSFKTHGLPIVLKKQPQAAKISDTPDIEVLKCICRK